MRGKGNGNRSRNSSFLFSAQSEKRKENEKNNYTDSNSLCFAKIILNETYSTKIKHGQIMKTIKTP